ncbi:MAG TPA: GTPase ObgE [Myxococcota bacterium]|nr:GTPase ObgE [Myxococcota bacterium]
MKHANLFVDEAELEVRSGAGGDGNVGFRREKFISKGGPNGGDGGRGGDVVLVADPNVSTLLDLKSARKIKAPDGQRGGSWNKKGASGESLEVRVPVGTLVFDLGENETDPVGPESETGGGAAGSPTTPDEGTPLVDLREPGQRFVVARGGAGGLGNARFKTSTRQAPDFATPGKPAESRRIRLSLKLLADVGLVGFPNAGKSTLLRRISAARPRVASYPFTTLVPSLGVVELDDRRCVVADIPGLIEGASDGAGLGHQFLRHVERTRALVHLLDVEAMLVEGRDLIGDHEAIRRELGRYQPKLLERREIVVLSKCDLVHDEAILGDLLTRLEARGIRPLRISAAVGAGIDALVRAIFEALDETRRAEERAAAAERKRSGGDPR